MKFKLLKAAFVGLILAVSSFANAGIIALDDWWLQTDSLGGLRQSSYESTMYFAVSKNTQWDKTATYEIMNGFHWATSTEAIALLSTTNTGPTYTYFGQGGWNGYEWEGDIRYFFRFSDSVSNNAYKNSGTYDSYGVNYDGDTRFHAGLVLIKDSPTNSTSVPEPSTLAIIALGMIGFASRQFKKKS
jgi:hypothetical protein